MSPNDSQKKVVLAKEGNQEALGALYDEYVDAIYRFFYWQTNQDSATAEDLTQETFLEMAKSIRHFRGEASFKNWLYTIAKHRLSKWVKRKYDLPQEPLFDNLHDPAESIDPQTQKHAVLKVEKLLQQLATKERAVITLRYLKNFSVKEAAQELNISTTYVKVLTHRTLKKMKALSLK